MTKRYCTLCREFDDDHCRHEYIDIPASCKCRPEVWTGEVPNICHTFEINSEGICKHCQHERECHDVSEPTNTKT